MTMMTNWCPSVFWNLPRPIPLYGALAITNLTYALSFPTMHSPVFSIQLCVMLLYLQPVVRVFFEVCFRVFCGGRFLLYPMCIVFLLLNNRVNVHKARKWRKKIAAIFYWVFSSVLQRAAKLALQSLYGYGKSVRPSVCPSHSGIASKRGNADGRCLHSRVAQCLYFSVAVNGKIWVQTGRPPTKTAEPYTFRLITPEP